MNTFECFRCGDIASQVVTLCKSCASDIKELAATDSQQRKGETVRCCANCQYAWPECGAKNMGCEMFSPRTASPVA
jgi:hypothetical protein